MADAMEEDTPGTSGDPPSEEDVCRYCLGPFYAESADEEPDPKIAPCKCRGGQQWCHLSCLRQWQRSVLVTQPTHPAFYERDERQFTCNVCASPFSVEPPSRGEMMRSFTGPELAALLDKGCLIVCEPKTSEYMAGILEHNAHIRQVQDMANWVESVYLITEIETSGASDGEDGIIAVNLSRPFGGEHGEPPAILLASTEARLKASDVIVGRTAAISGLKTAKFNGEVVTVVGRAATGRAAVRLPSGKKIAVKPSNLEFIDDDPPPATVSHYIGGPCYPSLATGLAVLTATHVDELAAFNVRVGGAQGGLWVTGDLDDVAAVARHDAGRVGAAAAHVDAYWGDARWSRTQLLGEIARGSWGMCRAEITDVTSVAPADGEAVVEALLHLRWSDIIGAAPPRLVYAQKSEMTDEDIHGEGEQLSAEEEDAAARELNAKMEETRRRLRAQLLARHADQIKAATPAEGAAGGAAAADADGDGAASAQAGDPDSPERTVSEGPLVD
eukprot:CAMPEP_0182949906 /NCGR_PEP_ID=MMETSP0105_2-20130417/60498_1 /TAXON_ID=81532 ORGANISM="Acanthoeca-like sp., Strain 10tr" /NCGR_SAMPLE_ID=MMETSP0105_2 /ASSEMBLY_ACC=CAM_ASM_000205 /LENGTH=500 /DNA_ID=CAMNT_0025090207 /DNA_START=53 /DNA_END=1555 /DNA_ORIENTATION=+